MLFFYTNLTLKYEILILLLSTKWFSLHAKHWATEFLSLTYLTSTASYFKAQIERPWVLWAFLAHGSDPQILSQEAVFCTGQPTFNLGKVQPIQFMTFIINNCIVK